MCKQMTHNDVVYLLNRLDLVDKISDEEHTKIYSKHHKKCKFYLVSLSDCQSLKNKKYKHAKNAKESFE